MPAGSTIEPAAILGESETSPDARVEQARRRAEALNLEFSAPVGLLESHTDGRASWAVRIGREDVRWPKAEIASWAVADAGRSEAVSLWLPGPTEDHLWMILKMPADSTSAERDASETTAWVGFALSGSGSRGAVRPWGPTVPSPGLLAWGREVVSRLESKSAAENSAASGKRPELRLPDRLTRELSVSDPPERFQRLAVESIREALEVEAVAWVPRSHRESVIVAGSLSGMSPESFRDLLPNRSGIEDRNRVGSGSTGHSDVRHALAVASDPEGAAGWLVAVNPIDDRPFERGEADLLQPIASLIASQRNNARHYAELKELLFGVIRSLTAAIDAKDPYTLGHSERVGRIAVQLGEALGLSANERGDLDLCGLLHDVGKIGVSDAILQKPGPLTPEEFSQIRLHVRMGVQILSDLKKLHHLLPGVAHHHESFDGSGYPDGLSGMQIPKIARILAVADAFDAMSSTRPYRRRLAADQIDRIFRDGSGSQWDPEVVDALFTCRAQVEAIRQKGLGDSVMQVVDDTISRNQGVSIISRSTEAPISTV